MCFMKIVLFKRATTNIDKIKKNHIKPCQNLNPKAKQKLLDWQTKFNTKVANVVKHELPPGIWDRVHRKRKYILFS